MNNPELADFIYTQLMNEAQYALSSKSRELASQTYGEAYMARNLGAISKEQFIQLNGVLVAEGLNNAKIWNNEH